MLRQNKLPELRVEGVSTAFKKKQPRVLLRDQQNDENNNLLLKALIDKNVKHSKSCDKNYKTKRNHQSERGRSTPLKQVNKDLKPNLKNKPFLRLDNLQFSHQTKLKSKSTPTQLRSKRPQHPRRFSEPYPSSKPTSLETIPLKMRNGNMFRLERRSILNQHIKLPNEFSNLQEYLNSNELNLSLVIREKMIHTNFLKEKREVRGGSVPLRIFP